MTGSAFAVLYVLLPPSFSSVITRGRVREGEGHRVVAGRRSADDGKRLCETSRRGTLCNGWLRRIYSFRKGEVWRGIAPGCTGADGWRIYVGTKKVKKPLVL